MPMVAVFLMMATSYRDLKKDSSLINKWVDIKGFDTPERAEELLEILKGK